jgi:hypothetical protein
MANINLIKKKPKLTLRKIFNNEGIQYFMAVFFVILMYTFMFWLAGSVIASSVKAISDKCGSTYPIENIVATNWFCAEESR